MKRYYRYEEFVKDVHTLVQKVQNKGVQIDTIVALARGGVTLAHALSEALELRDLQTIQTQLYDGEKKRNNITIKNSTQLCSNTTVLVVDDIADSGETLLRVMKQLHQLHPDVRFITATLFYKKSSVFTPDIWIHEANEWIEFFWENDFTL
jgi:xanthine phosphoribosyltransferase